MKKRVDFSKYSSIRVGAIKDVLIIDKIKKYNDLYLIGLATNTLVTNNAKNLAMLSNKFNYITIQDDILKIGGATPSGKIHSFCKKHDIYGFEYLYRLPGRLGGLVKMNAGMKEDEIFNNLLSLNLDGNDVLKQDIEYGYRFSSIKGVVFEARFKITRGYDEKRFDYFNSLRLNQPKGYSLGSVFKNPKNDFAARLIQEVGLKGKRIGNIGYSDVHANFLINYGGAKIDDMLELISLAQSLVYKKFNIKLQKEIIIL